MTTTIITRPQPVRTEQSETDDLFTRVLDAVNSHRAHQPPRPRCTDPIAALGAHLLAAVRAQDAAISLHRRAPRTVAQMQARLNTVTALFEDEDDACGVCGYFKCRCGGSGAA